MRKRAESVTASAPLSSPPATSATAAVGGDPSAMQLVQPKAEPVSPPIKMEVADDGVPPGHGHGLGGGLGHHLGGNLGPLLPLSNGVASVASTATTLPGFGSRAGRRGGGGGAASGMPLFAVNGGGSGAATTAGARPTARPATPKRRTVRF